MKECDHRIMFFIHLIDENHLPTYCRKCNYRFCGKHNSMNSICTKAHGHIGPHANKYSAEPTWRNWLDHNEETYRKALDDK